jgi:hypothetical protein
MNAAVEPVARDRVLLSIEAIPISVLWRAAIGFGLMPAYFVVLGLVGWRDSTAALLLFLLAVLVALRMAPAVLRRLLPVSKEVSQAWAHRRVLAKSYDSFQWRKLLGLGLGWLTWMLTRHSVRIDALLLAGMFVIGGLAGQIIWARISKTAMTEGS